MKVKLSTVLTARLSLDKLREIKINSKTAYRLAALATQLEEHQNTFLKTRLQVIKACDLEGRINHHGALLPQEGDNRDELLSKYETFIDEITELGEQMVTIKPPEIHIDDFKNSAGEQIDLTFSDLQGLTDFITE